MLRSNRVLILCISLLIFACSRGEILPDLPENVQAVSLLGDTLYSAEPSEQAMNRYMNNLSEAETKLAADPEDADALVWKG
ncbi:hypothetical protein ACFL5P_04475, partial [candidate division KSB1 bacterium]